jgi:hypothetical protein
MRAHHFILVVSIAIALGGSAKAAGGLMQLQAYGVQDANSTKEKQKIAPPKRPSQITPTNPNYNVPRVKNGMGGKAYSN